MTEVEDLVWEELLRPPWYSRAMMLIWFETLCATCERLGLQLWDVVVDRGGPEAAASLVNMVLRAGRKR